MTKEEKIQSFCQYTRLHRADACLWLEMSSWDLDKAKHRYWLDVIMLCDLECDD